jgi:peptidoglycan biosynthesis protein MviN/MurJ (putative lipid II flippase)
MINKIIKIVISMGLTIFLMRAMNYEVSYGTLDAGLLSVVSLLYAVMYFRLKRKPSKAAGPETKRFVFTAE